MNKLVVVIFGMLIVFNISCHMNSLGISKDVIHYVVIETNVNEVAVLRNSIAGYKPNDIQLPSLNEISYTKKQKSTFWYRTEEGGPRKSAVFNSPSDTIGLNVIKIEEPKTKISNSGLDVKVNGFGPHYCIVVKQFINIDEANYYINLLKNDGILSLDNKTFAISNDNYGELRKEYTNYFENQ